MGQYYKPVNLDRRKFLDSHDFSNGLKLMEHSWLRNDFVGYVAMKLANEWKGDTLIWAGDYGDVEKFVPSVQVPLYQIASDLFIQQKPTEEEINELELDNIDKFNEEYPYLVNYDNKQFVDTRNCPNDDGWIVHPLPLLVSDGNGRGGGDYRPLNELDEKHVGLWAGDSIGVEKKDTDMTAYTEIKPDFIEEF